MPARNVDFVQGGYYHVYNRGAGRHPIFFNEDNYLYCLRLIKKQRQRYNVSVIAYCLMPNHYHFLLRQDGDAPLSRFVGAVFNAYVQAVNRQQERSGTLFEGRFKVVCVDDEAYLAHLCRYIHANPAAAGLVDRPEAWPYSNYPEWIGARAGSLLDPAFVATLFESGEAYREYVQEYVEGIVGFPEAAERYLLA